MKPIFTALSPNAEWDDVKQALHVLLHPSSWTDEHFVQELEDWFKHYLSVPYAYAFDSGRTGLSVLLASQNLKKDAEVLLQAYTCVAVPNPIIWSGATPIYVDIDPKTLTMSVEDLARKISSRSRALIIQHTFGQPADLDRLLAIAKRHDLFIIEDCTHALGATYRDQPVGSFGDASFFSFGRDKVVSSILGGMVCTRHPELAEHLSRVQKSYPSPSLTCVVQYLLHPVICQLVKTTYAAGLGKVLLAVAKKTGLVPPPVEPQERRGEVASFLFHRFSPALAQLAIHQLKKLDYLNQHRRELAKMYHHGLASSRFHLPHPLEQTQSIFLRYTVQHPQRQAIMREAREQSIFLGDWYTSAIAPSGVDTQAIHYTACPTAEAVAKDSLNLPTDIHITPGEVERILNLLKPYL